MKELHEKRHVSSCLKGLWMFVVVSGELGVRLGRDPGRVPRSAERRSTPRLYRGYFQEPLYTHVTSASPLYPPSN